jgi:hypothetical protein
MSEIDPMTGTRHAWTPPDKDGMQTCRREGCTTRTARHHTAWQKKPGGHWREVHPLFGKGSPLPDCGGDGVDK